MRLLWAFLLLLIVSTVFAAKDRSRRRERNRNKRVRGDKDAVLEEREVDIDDDDDDDEYTTLEVKVKEEEQQVMRNPCNTHRCKRGEICELQEDHTPKCICQTCAEPKEDDIKVCSRDNVTYASECHLDRDHCLCKSGHGGCSEGKQYVRLDYYSGCKELTECPENEMVQFPRRMREWLFQIMTTLAYRHDLDEYHDMTVEAMNDEEHADAVIWKFCDLDKDPEDRHVTRRELMYIVASVKHMEHCLVPFLNKCDADDDNTITLVEWGTCLGIHHDAITDKCKKHVKA